VNSSLRSYALFLGSLILEGLKLATTENFLYEFRLPYQDFGNETKRINISVSADFLDRADQYAKEHHLSRSALLQKATMVYMDI
jgi:hypothetical protein